MSGLDVVRWLRENDQAALGMEVVVVSAWTGDQSDALRELGVQHVLEKPLCVVRLKQLIADVAAGKDKRYSR